jgi:uncharacterized DUF497 family protein
VERHPRFEWDTLKASDNVAKHRVFFEEAMTVFGDPLSRVVQDERHSFSEQRLWSAKSVRGRLLV